MNVWFILYYSILRHPILVKLHNMVVEQELLGLRLPLGKPCNIQALTNAYVMFLTLNRENISKTKMYKKCLTVDMHKFVLNLCIQNKVLGLGWLGRIAHHGMITWISNWGGSLSCQTY